MTRPSCVNLHVFQAIDISYVAGLIVLIAR